MLQITPTLSSVVRIQKARTALLLDHPFFGTLLFRLGARARNSIATMATDGVSLYFNPQFVEKLSSADLIGTLAHETMHPALQHHTRRAGRSPKRWNMACDYAINPMLLDAGLTLPNGVLCEARFRGMSAEEIYNRLEAEEQQSSQDSSDAGDQGGNAEGGEESAPGSNDPDTPQVPKTAGGIGQVLDAVTDADGGGSVEEQARDWQMAVQQAENVARLAGKMPAGAVRSLETSKAANVDWRELLRRVWSETIPADYGWIRPNRRPIWNGLYLPGVTESTDGNPCRRHRPG
jgi:predicted metal-dependent peptidase